MKKAFFFLTAILALAFTLPVSAQNCSVNADIDRTICSNQTMTLNGQYTGSMPANPVTTWSQVSGPSVVITSPNSLVTTVTGFSGGNTYRFRLTTTCQDGVLTFDDVRYTVIAITTANAGPDAAYCPGSGYQLAGSTPGTGETGVWAFQGTNNAGITGITNVPNSTFTLPAGSSGSTTIRWTLTKGDCISYDDVVITNYGGVSPVTAGPDQTLSQCYSTTTSTTLAGSFDGTGVGGQTGQWILVSGPNSPTFNNINVHNTTLSNLIPGTYTLRWVVSGPCVNGSDEVVITVPQPIGSVTGTGGISDQVFCDLRNYAILTGPTPLYINETSLWTIVSKPSGAADPVIADPTNPVTMVSFTAAGEPKIGRYRFRYTITNSVTGCNSSDGSVDITFNTNPTLGTVNDLILPCATYTATISGTHTGSGTVQYKYITWPTGFTPPNTNWNDATTNSNPWSQTLTGLTTAGNYYLQIRKSSGSNNACGTVYEDINITVSRPPLTANAGTDQLLACNVTSTAMVGNVPDVGTGTWYQVSGPNTAVIGNIHQNNSPISGMIPGKYVFRWIINAGPYCPSNQDDVIIITTAATPSQPIAGIDAGSCYGTPYLLLGNSPGLLETGTWTAVPSSGISFTPNANTPHAYANGMAANTAYKFIWSFSNACGILRDTVIITTTNSQGASVSNAGTDLCLAAGTTSASLNGNNPAPGTGTWTALPPTGITFSPNANTMNAMANGLGNGTYKFIWTIGVSGCTSTTDTVVVTISNPVTTAAAGTDQQICGTSATLAGNNPTVGTGTWTQTIGPPGVTITNPSLYNTPVTFTNEGDYVFTWTISNGACASSSDEVMINVNFPPSTASAGVDTIICNPASVPVTRILYATPVTVGTGIWSIISGPTTPTIANPTLYNSQISDLYAGSYTLRWSVSKGPFCPPSTDDLTITILPKANAGADAGYCGITEVSLTGNAGSTGTWTQVLAPPTTVACTVTTNGPSTAVASALTAGNVYRFRYALSSGACISADTVQYTITASVTASIAGTDLFYCQPVSALDTFYLAGNTPGSGETGKWTKLSGGPTAGSFIPNDASPTAKYVPGGTAAQRVSTYYFVWTISNGGCSSADQVRVINYGIPTTPNAGSDQIAVCDSVATLAANAPSIGTGIWSQVDGPAGPIIQAPYQPGTLVTNLKPATYPTSYKFEWAISNGVCSVKRDTVLITVQQLPTVPNAGPDQNLCNLFTYTMQGNVISTGSGSWTQPLGQLATIVTPSAYNSVVNFPSAGTYQFTWNASNSPSPCSLADNIVINVYDNPSLADAGPNQQLCQFDALFLAATPPSTGTGAWTQYSGPNQANILSPSSPSSQVIGTETGTYRFVWTVSNGTCPPSYDTVNCIIFEDVTIALAGPDQILCNTTSTNLAGNTPEVGTGTWTTHSGPNTPNFVNPNLPTTEVNGLIAGTYKFIWKIQSGPCEKVDTMKVTVLDALNFGTVADNDETICIGGDPANITLITAPSGGAGSFTYQWYFQNGIVTCPTGTGNSGWTVISSATSSSYNPPSGLTGSRTFAVMVNPTGSPDCGPATWATGCRKVTVLLAFSSGSLQAGDESICAGGDPSNIIFSTLPIGGAGTYNYQWYYKSGLQSCPSGTNNSGWIVIDGAISDSYDPPTGLTESRTYAVMVDATGSPDCGIATWATSCRKVTVNPLPTISVTTPVACAPNGLTYSVGVTVSSGTVTSTAGTVTNTGGNVWSITAIPAGTNVTITVKDANNCENFVNVISPVCILPGNIGNFVWIDSNANGIQDSGEPGLTGVTVNLLDGSGNPVLDGNGVAITTVTDATGFYSFTLLPPGSYIVDFILPSGYNFTLVNSDSQGVNGIANSDANPQTGQTVSITLGENETNNNLDAGLYQSVSLGNFVWIDSNVNGIQDSGEPGQAGVTVNLLDGSGNPVLDGNGVAITTVTDISGFYSFTGLIPGTYSVDFVLPSGYLFSLLDADNQGINGAANSDANTVTGQTTSVTLTSGQTNNNLDAGLYQTTSLGNYVWIDSNANGIQNIGETGVAGVTVNLLDGTGNPVLDGNGVAITTVTDISGFYSFTGLLPGTYSVEFDLPSGYLFSQPDADNQGINGAVNSDANTVTGQTTSVTLTSGQTNNNLDAGLFQSVSLGNFVWIDSNANGIQDIGETGVAGVTVNLLDGSGNPVLDGNGVAITTVTDASGFYSFTGLIPGTYSVDFVLPSGYLFSQLDADNQGINGAVNSDANTVTGQTTSVTLTSGQTNNNLDAGLYQSVSLGNFVWIDSNANGIQNIGETGVAGVTVNLLDGSGNPVLDGNGIAITTVTDATGFYSFTGLLPGTYSVEFDLPSGYLFSQLDADNQGINGAANSDANTVTGQTTSVTLTSGQTNNNLDAGLYQSVSLGNFVWIDSNVNGIQDSGEPGQAGVTVNLLDGSGNPVLDGNGVAITTVTDASGFYSFTGLIPGTYSVDFVLPSGYLFSQLDADNQGINGAVNSDANTVTGQTTSVTLTSGQTNNNLDAGLYQTTSLGNFVWIDSNANGIQNIGETGVAGVTVNLLDGSGNPVLDGNGVAITTVTDINGFYSFTDLLPGTYSVEFDLPSGYLFSQPDADNQGINGAVNSDANTVTGQTTSVTLTSGQTNNNLDAGLFQSVSLGNFVWIDSNANGIQDIGETGVAGVTVNLLDGSGNPVLDGNGVAITTVTDASGFYSFTGLIPGTYSVDFVLPSGYLFSQLDADNQGINGAVNSDANTVTGQTTSVTLTSGQTNNNLDAGLYQSVSLGNFVWIDSNANGIQNIGETGVAGVTVNLLDGSGNPVLDGNGIAITTVTDATGFYSFTGLLPGTYSVEFDLPSGYLFSQLDADNQGINGAANSDANTVTGQTTSVTLTSGQTNNNLDAGLYQSVSLGNFVWIDSNVNGIQDSGEPGQAGVTVNLLDGSGNPVLDGNGVAITTVTDASGFYSFTGLIPGTYSVDFVLPSGYLFSLLDADNQGINGAANSDANTVTGQTTSVTLTSGQTNNNLDAGLYQTTSLGNFVWIDSNANGIQNIGETGVAGVTVNLLDGSGNPVLDGNGVAITTVTDINGFYSFTDLLPGTYSVEFDLPSGYLFSQPDADNQGINGAANSDANTVTGQTTSVTLSSGQTNNNLDAGLYQSVSLGNFVWIDSNANGIQDIGETGVAGVTVNLLDGSGNPVLDGNGVAITTVTDASGFYSFTGLLPGTYSVDFVLPSGYLFSQLDADNQGINGAVNSDANTVTGQTTTVTLTSGQTNNNLDAGLYQSVSLGNFVWIDSNANGIQNIGETGVAGVTVNLLDGSGNPVLDGNGIAITTVTDATGFYSFTGLLPGTYSVEFDLPSGYLFSQLDADNQGINGAANSDANTVTGQTTSVTLTSGQTNNNLDAGLYQSVSLGNFVWIDSNVNGIQDSGEPGQAGVTVNLLDGSGNPVLDGNGVAITTVTDASGFYSFTGLIPGTYSVDFVLPSGYLFSLLDADNQGINGAANSDANTVTGQTTSVTLTSGQTNNNLDAGLYQTTSLGNFVWIDSNANGIQNIGETGVAGVTVNLLDGSGNPVLDGNGVAITTVTDISGFYSFTDLLPGTYSVEFDLPSGYLFSQPDADNQGINGAANSDANTVTGQTTSVTLTSGQTNNNLDAGLYQSVSLGNFVWIDSNANGIQDIGETGVAGVTVNLLDGSGNPVLDGNGVAITTVTDASGFYSFTGLLPGTYSVDFVLPSGYLFSQLDADNQGINGAVNSDANTVTGQTTTVTLTSGQTNNNLDAGLYQSVSLGNFVWIDSNANGIQNIGETGVAGVTVNLLDGSGNPVLDGNGVAITTVTDATGFYSFTDLLPGTYSVEFDLPSGYLFSQLDADNQGINGAANSDANTVTGQTTSVTLTSGQTNDNLDAGLYQSVSLGNFVWIDSNANGIQDSGEPGLAGVTVNLLDGSGNPVLDGNGVAITTVTDATGFYSFTGLLPGTYSVGFDLPSGYLFSQLDADNQGINGAANSDANTVTGQTTSVTLTSGQTNNNLDAGLYQTTSLGNFVWIDSNANGIQNSGETGQAGVTVNLLDGSGNPVLDGNGVAITTVTDISGFYSFTDLLPGTYSVEFDLPSGYLFSQPDADNQGINGADNSDAIQTTGQTISITLISGENNNNLDAGLIQFGVSSWVFLEGSAIDPECLDAYYEIPMRADLNLLHLLPGQSYQDFYGDVVYTPAGQPYSSAPWNYNGSEGNGFNSGGNPAIGDAGYDPTVVDWILVSLRTSPLEVPFYQKAALLHQDGSIEFVNGLFDCELSFSEKYYLVIEHRNHLIIMSDTAISIINGQITYDFRNTQSYLDNPSVYGQKEILPGVFAMYAGNGDQVDTGNSDTSINDSDLLYWEGQNGVIGRYIIGDYNLTGDVNYYDKAVWFLNNNISTSVPRN